MSIKPNFKTKRLSGDFSSQITRGNVATFLTQLGLSSSSSSSLLASSSSSSLASTSASSKTLTGVDDVASNKVIEMTDMAEYRRSVLHSYTIRFIGSTPLRRRQTYPMLDWILTDLLYQSKCIGMDLSVCITNCLMKENDQERMDGFRRLKQQLTEDPWQENNGLVVRMDIVNIPDNNTSTSCGTYVFQICNPLDGQNLLRHKFSRIFLFGKYVRQPSLFYYVHKSDDDVVNSVPTIYLFQATNSVQQTEICMKFNELRAKLSDSKHQTLHRKPSSSSSSSDSDLYIYNPFLDHNQINVNNNCFEVRHIGSVVILQKRSTPSMIDRAAEKFHLEILKDYPQQCEQQPINIDSSNDLKSDKSNFSVLETKENSTDEAKIKKSFTNSSPKTSSEVSSKETNNNKNLDVKPTVITTTGCSRRQYRKNRFLVEVIEENESLDINESQQGRQQQTAVFDDDVHHPLGDMIIGQKSEVQASQTQPNKTMLFIIGTMDICLISTENHRTVYSKIFANISHCSQGCKHADHFGVIVREPYVPPSPSSFDFSITAINKTSNQLQTSSKCSSPTAKPQSVSGSNSNNSNTEGYVLHIFQCQAESIVNDLLCSLRQSFNNAFRHNNNKAWQQQNTGSKDNSPSSWSSSQESLQSIFQSQTCSKSTLFSTPNVTSYSSYCQNCPMNWFHQLCLDIYGLDNVKIFAMLLHRIRHGSSERRWREYYTIFEYLQLERLEQRVDLLVIMLKARVEKMQRYHEIRDGQCRMDMLSLYEQIEQHDPVLRQYQQQKSTLSLNRLEGLRLMARSSLTNTFDAFRKRNRNSQSNENLQNSSSTTSPYSSMTSINSPPSISTNNAIHLINEDSSSNNNKTTTFQRRNTVADCYREDMNTNPDLPSTTTTTNSLSNDCRSKFCKSDSIEKENCKNEKATKELDKLTLSRSTTPARNQPLMDIYIKTSSGNAMFSAQFSSMDELRQNLNQLLDPKLLSSNNDEKTKCLDDDVFFDDDDNESISENSDNPDDYDKSNVIDPQSCIQMRHRIFRRVRKSFNPYKTNGNIEQLINNKNNKFESKNGDQFDGQQEHQHISSSTKARQLWRFAIRKQIQLLKQERLKKFSQENLKSSRGQQKLKVFSEESQNIVRKTNYTVTPDTLGSIMDRIGHLYQDIPRIGTQSQLKKIVLHWEKLIEMFETYCHNNPEDIQTQNKKQDCTINTQYSLDEQQQISSEIQSQTQTIHWWSHYERSIIDALRIGVPKEIRSTVWRFLAKYQRYRRSGSDGNNCSKQRPPYRSLLKQLAIHQHAIFVDLGRTFPNVPYFAEPMGPGQLALYNLLKAYSLLDKEVEYCQGLSFVAGILLLHMNEDDAFDQLCYVLYECGLREQYKPSMDALQMQMYQLNRLLYDLNRPLYDHLDRMDISPTLYAAPSFLTLFASQFPIGFVTRIFDLLMFYGLESIFRVFYYLIDRIKDEILNTKSSDLESIMDLMRTRFLLLNQDDMTHLFNQCLNNQNLNNPINSIHNRLEQYRLEYKILQEEFVHLSQINKLAVEQKLQKKQQKKPPLIINEDGPQQTNNYNGSSTDLVNKSDGLQLSSKLVECLREENIRLREQNEQLQKQNAQLKYQVEELSTQIRRQSH